MIKFKFIQDFSVKNKIVTIILLVTYLCTGLGFTFFAIWDINRLKSEIQSNLTLNAKLIGDNCIVPLSFDDKLQATKTLSHLRYFNFIETSYLYDKEGNLFASYPDSIDKSTFLPLNKQVNTTFKNGYFYIKEAVLFQDERYGTIFLKANSKLLTDVKRNLVLILSSLTLILFFLSFILASRMQGFISIPIIKLKNHFNKIAENHDFTAKIRKQSNDEIGSLYDGFNNLISQIEIRRKERDKAEENYKDSQNKLNLALQGGEIGIWEWDLETNRTLWDVKMESMFGLKEGEFKQTYEAFKECLHPDDIATTENEIKNARAEIKPYDTVFRVIWKNKEIKYIKAKANIAKNKEGKQVKMIGVCFDITEIKKTEEELKEHRNKLEDLVNERTQELELKYSELEKMNKIFVGRELKMIELKKTISKLKNEVNKPE
jgi:PAS domain S-box-containing protein